MAVDAPSVLEIFVTGSTVVVFIGAEVKVTHVPSNAVSSTITFSTNQTDKSTITSFNLAPHQFIQRGV